MYEENNGTSMFPLYGDENQLQYDSNAPRTQLQLFGNVPAGCIVDSTNYVVNNNMASINRPNKRRMESEDVPIQQKVKFSSNNVYLDEVDMSTTIPNSNAVSTGLQLSYNDAEHNSSVTSASENMLSLPIIVSIGDISTEIERQKEEFDHYIRTQEEEFAKGVKQMKQRHLASFLNAIEKGVSQKISKKELEIDIMNRKNKDLTDKIKLTAIEAQNWKHRAHYNESMVYALQNNLKQSLAALGNTCYADQRREGCGDNLVDDAVSSNKYDHHPPSNQNMKCRVCGRKEVCMLILPCRHLCLCKDCDTLGSDACPVCLEAKIASVEVYMS